MKQRIIILVFIFLFNQFILPKPAVQGQLVLAEVIRTAIKRVVKAVDLKIQRLQNKTIWLQQAQKAIENLLSKTRLDEIAQWSFRQKEEFEGYYSSLMKVKSVIVQFQQVRELAQKQVAMFRAYQRSWNILKNDPHFSIQELQYMAKTYAGFLEESLQNIDELTALVQSYTFQLSDGERMSLIQNTKQKIEENYHNLLEFNRQNQLLSLQRSKSNLEIQRIKKLYEIQ